MSKLDLFASGFSWPEAPRLHGTDLYISDVHSFRVARVGSDGAVTTVINIPQRPAGMDIQADGTLILATSLEPLVMHVDLDGTQRSIAKVEDVSGNFNDMITGPDGWSWIGDTGFTFGVDDPVEAGAIFAHHLDHGIRKLDHKMFFPNGMVVSGGRLIVCETFGKRLTSFTIAKDGNLADRHLMASLPGHPDGLCLNPDGSVWVPLLLEAKFVRVSDAGVITHTIDLPEGDKAIACARSEDTLYLCTCTITAGADGPLRDGRILITAAD